MKLDTEKIDRVVLALLHLGLHDDYLAWKSFDWDALDRLHKKGFISSPSYTADKVKHRERFPLEPGSSMASSS
jgi:hypothetical protein